MVDYIVVGLGLAGISFCEQLEKHNKSYVVISNDFHSSSKVAGGIYNPVILKRFTLPWMVKEQLEIALPFYQQLEKKLNTTFLSHLSILRRFHSIEEQNLWFEATDRPGVGTFLFPKLLKNKNKNVDAPFGFGRVLQTHRIDTKMILTSYQKFLKKSNKLRSETFNYDKINFEKNSIYYGDTKALNIVFCEGFGVQKNPYFKYLPIKGTKGEYVLIKAPELKEEKAIKASIFCIPLGNDVYKIGANYDHNDKTFTPTAATRKLLIEKLKTFIKCDFEVVDQVAGIRPTVVDRKPIIGSSIQHKGIHILNGLGSRGIIAAPFLAQKLFNHIESDGEIEKEININRFTDKYFKV